MDYPEECIWRTFVQSEVWTREHRAFVYVLTGNEQLKQDMGFHIKRRL